MLFFGNIISKDSSTPKIIEGIEFDVTMIGNNAKVIATHHIHNTTETTIDAVISMTLDDETVVSGFEIENNGKIITSQLKEKEQAKQEQKDASSNGYSSAVMEKTDDTTFSLSIGLIEKDKTMIVRVTYLTKMLIDGDNIIMRFPESVQKDINYSVNVHSIDGNCIKLSGKLSGEDEISVKKSDKQLIVMKDEDTDEIIAASTFENKEESGNVEVIFVCDRSGSMNGEGIKALKETLQLFLRQLPEGSKFNIISFGSRFECMFEESIEYNEQTLENASNEVKKFEANYGGTNLKGPLEEAMKHKCQIIILTDGEAFDKEEVIEMCKKDHDNVVHMVGLGNGVDVEMIRNVARICGGLSAISKNPLKLKEAISRITSRILTPLINEPKAKWSVKGEQYPLNINKFNSDTTVFLKLEKEENNIKCELEGKVNDKNIILKNESNEITNGLIVEQLYAASLLRELEANNKKEEAIKISLKYNVLSKYTAFISIDKSSKQEINDVKVVKLDEIRRYNVYNSSMNARGRPIALGAPRLKCCAAPPRPLAGARVDFVMLQEEKCECVKKKKCVPKAKKCETNVIGCCAPPPPPCAPKQIEEKNETKTFKELNKDDEFNKLIELQKANGSFNDLEGIYPSIKEIINKYNSVDKTIIMTIIGMLLFELRFNDKKVEWNLLHKKAKKYLEKQSYDKNIENDVASMIKSF